MGAELRAKSAAVALLCAPVLLVACTHGSRTNTVERAAAPPAEQRLRAASTDLPSVERVVSDSELPDSAGSGRGDGVPEVAFEVEPPYKPYERPRPEGAVLAAGVEEELARWNVGGSSAPEFTIVPGPT